MRPAPRRSSAAPAHANAPVTRGRRIHANLRVPVRLPMANAMLSPATAPAAATTPSIARSGPPVDAATAAAATSTVSLGTGGKKPSMTATTNMAR